MLCRKLEYFEGDHCPLVASLVYSLSGRLKKNHNKLCF